MKQSLYNYCFKNGDNIIMFNARTNALAKLSLNEYEQLKKCDLGTKKHNYQRVKRSSCLWRIFIRR